MQDREAGNKALEQGDLGPAPVRGPLVSASGQGHGHCPWLPAFIGGVGRGLVRSKRSLSPATGKEGHMGRLESICEERSCIKSWSHRFHLPMRVRMRREVLEEKMKI